MRKIAFLYATFGAMLTVSLASVPARAQFYVASNGTGIACTIDAPCRTFQAAHNAAVAGREIKCLTAGDFAEVIITKSITIDCMDVGGAIIASGHAVAVNTPGLIVTLRGLDLQGVGLGPTAVDFAMNGELHVENCRIAGWQDGGLAKGIAFHPGAGTSSLFVIDSIVDNNGLAGSGGGIMVEPTGAATVNVVIQGTKVTSNTYGILADGTQSTGQIQVQIKDSAIAGNNTGVQASSGPAPTGISLFNSMVVNNQYGVAALGPQGFAILDRTAIQASGVQAIFTTRGGAVFSYGNNPINNNAALGDSTTVIGLR
jgi:hypothetical protein